MSSNSNPNLAPQWTSLLESRWPLVEAEIAAVVPRGHTGPTLPAMTWYHFSTGGKRLRALIPIAVADALGAESSRAIPFAAAVEMLHNATLVHDDLQDGDTHRRGLPTVWNQYGAAQAINCGDAMFYYTLQLAHRSAVPPATALALSNRILSHTIDVIAGQAAEFALKDNPTPYVHDYYAVVTGKTSGLFTLPLVGGALVAGAPESVVKRLEAAGGPLGVLFQVQDDVLDLVGDKGRGAKATDIAEGKVSLPAAHLFETASTEIADEFGSILRTPREETSPSHIKRALALLDEAGSLRFAAKVLRDKEREVAQAAAQLDHPALAAVLTSLSAVFLEPIRHWLDAAPTA